MGLYQDIQDDISQAFETDLLDATRTVNFITWVDTYDEVTMKSTQVETPVPVRAVVESIYESERIDEPTSWNKVKIFVLDSDRNGVVFQEDMLVEDGADRHKIQSVDSDPAKAGWTMFARRNG